MTAHAGHALSRIVLTGMGPLATVTLFVALSLTTSAAQVSKHTQCRIRVTIIPSNGVRGETFKVFGVAVAPYTDNPPLTTIDDFLLANDKGTNGTVQTQGDVHVPWAEDNIPPDARLCDTDDCI